MAAAGFDEDGGNGRAIMTFTLSGNGGPMGLTKELLPQHRLPRGVYQCLPMSADLAEVSLDFGGIVGMTC